MSEEEEDIVAFENDLLSNGWIKTMSTASGSTFSHEIPVDLENAMKKASAAASITPLGVFFKNIFKIKSTCD